MTTMDSIRNRNDLDVRWSAQALLNLLGFETKVRRRVADHLETRGIKALSLRDLIDLFLPPLSEPFLDYIDFWLHIPIISQPQFGIILHGSALVSLTDADFGAEFRAELASRLDRLKLYEIGSGITRTRRRTRIEESETVVDLYWERFANGG